MNSSFVILLVAALALLASQSNADPAVIEEVRASQTGEEWRFDVTLSHADTGWDDYADGWRIVDGEGTVLGFRELLHPHVNEQPFTRSLSGVSVPDAAKVVYVESRTNTQGWSAARFAVELERN